MESIDRLREHASIYAMEHSKRVLREIADAIEDEVAERYVELPLDADGVPIRVGDVMEEWLTLKATPVAEVTCLSVERDGWGVMLCDHSALVAPIFLRHYHEPTVEDVLREFGAEVEAVGGLMELPDGAIAEYASRLRLAGDDA